jgi:hypothetical protein
MLTEQERKVLDMTAELWDELIKLPAPHGHDNPEHMRDIHDIQNRVLARSARRELDDVKP